MFDDKFLWGCATAGYQVERAPLNADWDTLVDTPSICARIYTFHMNLTSTAVNYEPPFEGVSHENLDVLRVELDRMVALGLNAYRFSVEWNRIQWQDPRNSGGPPVFDTGWCNHYLDVIAEIVDRKMTPVISLNHMTLPSWVLRAPVASRMIDPFNVTPFPVAAEDGLWRDSLRGWETDDTVVAYIAFVRFFAQAVKNRFPDTPLIWTTMNEPIGSMVGAGYLGALWCPGFGGDPDRGRRVCLHLVKAHVLAYKALKSIDPDWQVGFVHAMVHATPSLFSSVTAGLETGGVAGVLAGAASGAVTGAVLGSELLGPLGFLIGLIVGAVVGAIVGGVVGGGGGAVVGAAENLQQNSSDQFDYFFNEWMLRAVVKGEIDDDLTIGTAHTPAEWDKAWTSHIGEAAGNRGSNLDFVGLNYYRRVHVYYMPLSGFFAPYTGGVFNNNMEGDKESHGVLNELGWEVFPEGLSSFLLRIKRDYNKPILITENGTPEALDANRAASLVAHVDEIRSAVEVADPPVVWGYIHWSVVDNWEWQNGYQPKARFGLFTVGDRVSAGRINIGSAMTFRRQITEAGLALRCLIGDPDAFSARTRFGAVSSGGERIDPPATSNGALWHGSFGRTSVKLFLDTTSLGAFTGLIYYANENVWLSLSDFIWDERSHRLSMGHGSRVLPRIPALVATLVLNLDTFALLGQATDPATRVSTPFRLSRITHHGLWLPVGGDGSWIAVASHQFFDGEPVIKRLLRGEGIRWEAIRAPGTGVPTFEGPSGKFGLAFGITDPRELRVIQSDLPADQSPTIRTFRRTPSSLVILNET